MIKSESFGGVVFSGNDAKQFANQVRHDRPTQAAFDCLRRGDELLQTFREKASDTPPSGECSTK